MSKKNNPKNKNTKEQENPLLTYLKELPPTEFIFYFLQS